MIYEMRTYECLPGKIRALTDRFANVTDRLFKKYGFRPVGYWTESIGNNTLFHYMLAWAEFRVDPERIEKFAESEKDGPLVAQINNRIWVGTPFSAIK